MISSKILALSLLLTSPLILARVQCKSYIEYNQQQTKQYIAPEILLDLDNPYADYSNDVVRIETTLVSESDIDITVRYSMYVKNEQDQFELLASPELCAVYGKTAQLTIQDENGDIFLVLKLEAKKV